jgi:hypothetical protein
VTVDQVLALFTGRGLRRTRRGWSARCPAHDDRANSLSIGIGDDSRTLLNCFAGCRTQAIVAAIGLSMRDLWPDNAGGRSSRQRPEPAPRPRSPLAEARLAILQEGQRQLHRLAPYRELNAEADLIRARRRVAAHARAVATSVGDCGRAWDLLAAAAELETDAERAEAALEASIIQRPRP